MIHIQYSKPHLSWSKDYELKQSKFLPAILSAILGCRTDIQSPTPFVWTECLRKKAAIGF